MAYSLVLMAVLATSPEAFADELAQKLVDAGVHRVGVVPRLLTRVRGQDVVASKLGPQSDLVPQELSQKLENAIGRRGLGGQLKIVPVSVMRKSFRTLTPEDLGSTPMLQRVGREAGVDVLLAITGMEKRNTFSLSVDLIRTDGNSAGVVRRSATPINVEDAAYIGESFELRRWEDGKLNSIGLKPPESSESQVSDGSELLFSDVTFPQQHPLAVKDMPVRFELSVPDRKLKGAFLNNQLYLALNPGETYQLKVWNVGPRPVYVGLYIDGINTIGKELESPAGTPEQRMWYIKPRPTPYTIKGFLTIGEAGKKDQSSEAFTVAPRDESIAAAKGFVDGLGMVTAVVYDFIPLDREKAIPQIGTKAGVKEAIEIKEWGTGTRGEMLAAMTIHYCTLEELQAMISQAQGAREAAGAGGQEVAESSVKVNRPEPGSFAEQAFAIAGIGDSPLPKGAKLGGDKAD